MQLSEVFAEIIRWLSQKLRFNFSFNILTRILHHNNSTDGNIQFAMLLLNNEANDPNHHLENTQWNYKELWIIINNVSS